MLKASEAYAAIERKIAASDERAAGGAEYDETEHEAGLEQLTMDRADLEEEIMAQCGDGSLDKLKAIGQMVHSRVANGDEIERELGQAIARAINSFVARQVH